jgi:PEP-CTERM motif
MKNSWIQTFRRLAAATVVAGSSMFYSAMCYANAFDVATNLPYADGWQAGDNGGTGFGPWSFNGTDATPAGTYQAMSSSSPIGTSWTLATHANNTGLANAGRAITGGLLPGQTFETVIDNPTGYHFFRGFDILLTSGPDNNAGGNNTSALRASVFNYYGSTTWGIDDAGGSSSSGINQATVAAAGMQLDLTLTSATTYSLTMKPLNGATPYTHAGTLNGAGLPITWVDYRLYHGTSTGAEDPVNNFEISRMTITPEPSTLALIGLGSAGLLFLRRRNSDPT